MTHAYPACYLAKAKDHLALAFALAIDHYGATGDDFAKTLARSPLGHAFEQGQPWAIAGRSGAEMALALLEELHGPCVSAEKFLKRIPPSADKRTSAYWVGWASAHCQWQFACSFEELFSALPYGEFETCYRTYHEADVSRMLAFVAERLSAPPTGPTPLACRRECHHLTQEQLASEAQVGLRSIQMYEQRRNDINKAQAATLLRLARVLDCQIEDLLDKPLRSTYEYALVPLGDAGPDTVAKA